MFKSLINSNSKILVIGDLMLDHYLWGNSDRISPEAPVPIVKIVKESLMLGGAGNVIRNLKAFEFDCEVLSVVGVDQNSKTIINLLEKLDCNIKNIIIDKNRIGTKKSRVISSNQQVLRIDKEISKEIYYETEIKLLKKFKKIIKNFDLVLISDYGKGIFSYKLTSKIISYCNSLNKKVLVDPKGNNYDKYKGSYLITPNRKESYELTKIKINDENTLKKSLELLKETLQLEIALITLSDDGIAILDDKMKIFPTEAREIYDVTGAGDTVLASLGICLASGLTIEESVKFSNLSAGVVISKIGSSTTTIEEIIDYYEEYNSESIVLSKEKLLAKLKKLRLSNKKIVFTNGCFDILHVGHSEYLKKAKKLGDILVVAVNSDKSIREIKGNSRPIINQNDRSQIISQLKSVDFVIIFDEETPLSLIKYLKPDILVKGGDYKGKDVVGSKFVKELVLIDYIDGKSTSSIINKINCQK